MDVGSSGSEILLGVEECKLLAKFSNGSYIFPEFNSSMSPAVSFQYNDTAAVVCLDHAPTLTKASLVKVYVLGVLALLSFLGNSATILSIRRSQRSKRMSRTSCSAIYSLILQLSIADLLVTVFCLAGEAAWSYTVEWLAGDPACRVFKFMQMFSLYLSTFILVLIGVDRFVAVRFPMKNLSTGSRGFTLIVLAWILSAIFSIPQVIVFHVAKGPFVEEFHQCVTHGSYTEKWQEQLYASFSLLFMFVLPLIILMSTYAATFVTISRSEKVFRAEVIGRRPDLNRRRLIHRAKMKSLRISVVIVIAFVVWWTPYYIMMIIFIFHEPDKTLSEDLQSGIFFFGMSNSLVNPLIYGAFQLWPGRRRRGSQSRDFSTSTRITQASILRSSTRVMDRINNTRTRRDSDVIPEESGLVTLDRDGISRNNSVKPKISSHPGRSFSTSNGVMSYYHHNLLSVPNGGAITRV